MAATNTATRTINPSNNPPTLGKLWRDMTTQEQTPNITLTDFEANRLTFQANGRTYIYDSRGYKFAHCPKTGDILTEPKESHLSGFDVGILFRAYDDSADKFFSFFTADCFVRSFF